MKRIAAILSIAALVGSAACDDDGEDEAPETEESEEAEGAEEAEEDQAEDAGEDDLEAEEDQAEGEEVSAADLLDGFEEAQDDWMGEVVTVEGLYFSTNTANDEINNIVVVATEDHAVGDDPTITCGFAEAPESVDLTQFDEVTVQGTVDEFFDEPLLEDCSIID